MPMCSLWNDLVGPGGLVDYVLDQRSIRLAPVGPSIAISSWAGLPDGGDFRPGGRHRCRRGFMEVTRSTVRTICPPAKRSTGPVCLRIPSRTGWFRVETAVFPFEHVDDAGSECSLRLEAGPAVRLAGLVKRLLADVMTRRMPEVGRNRLPGQSSVQPGSALAAVRRSGPLPGWGQPGPVVVPSGAMKTWCFRYQPPEGLAVDDPGRGPR